MKILLELRKVYHYYGKARALEEINLTIEEGALDAVIGLTVQGNQRSSELFLGWRNQIEAKLNF